MAFKFCFILRGLPGIGKDQVANFIGQLSPSTILSTDNFFTKSGKYTFDKTLLKEAHEKLFEEFKTLVSAAAPVIIINNTNIKKFHYFHYLDYAQRHSYLTSIITIPHNDVSNRELAERNVHGVDQDTIRRMRQSFDWSL
jgi:predicted kinase